MENLYINTNISSNQNQDYYTTGGRKVADFCLGFFGALIFNYLITIAYLLITYLNNGLRGSLFQYNSSIFLSFFGFGSLYYINLAILIPLSIFAFIKKRRLMGLGIILAILTPFILIGLLFGACLLGIIKPSF